MPRLPTLFVLIAIAVACLLAADTAKPQPAVSSVNIQDFGATPNDQTDDTAAIQKAIDSLTHGGDVIFPPGWYFLGSTLKVPAGVVLQGRGRPSPKPDRSIDWTGAWLTPATGFDGPLMLIDSVRDITINRIGFDGGDRGPESKSIGLSIQSNSTKSAALATADISISECTFACVGTGITWGRGNLEEQSDHVRIEHCKFSVAGVGISVTSGNAADYSCINHCSFDVSKTGIYLKSGFLAIRDCAAGGPNAVFIHRDGAENLLIENSQCEGMKAFLLVDGVADDMHAVNLVSNQIDCPIILNTICRVVATGNSYNAEIQLKHPGAKYLGTADFLRDKPYGIGYLSTAASGASLDLGGGRRWTNAGLETGGPIQATALNLGGGDRLLAARVVGPLDPSGSIDFGDGRRWTPQGLFLSDTQYWTEYGITPGVGVRWPGSGTLTSGPDESLRYVGWEERPLGSGNRRQGWVVPPMRGK